MTNTRAQWDALRTDLWKQADRASHAHLIWEKSGCAPRVRFTRLAGDDSDPPYALLNDGWTPKLKDGPETEPAPQGNAAPAIEEEGRSAMDQVDIAASAVQEPSRSEMHEAALTYAAQGRRVFPVNRQKRPLCPHGHHQATTNTDIINGWWTEWPEANIGCVPGNQGFCVVDLDPPDGEDGWAALQDQHGVAPQTWTVRSPRGGRHIYFAGHLPPTTGKLAPHVDTRGDNSYVLLPPSQTADGVYTVECDTNIAPVPEWIAPLLVYKRKMVVEAPADVPLDQETNIDRAWEYLSRQPWLVIGAGSDEEGYILANELRELGLSPETLHALLCQWQPGFDASWWQEKVANAFRYGQNGTGAYAGRPVEETFGEAAKLYTDTIPTSGTAGHTTVKTLADGTKVIMRWGDGAFPETMDLFRDLAGTGRAKPKADAAAITGEPDASTDRDQARRAERFRIYTEDDIDGLALPTVLIEGLLFAGADTYLLSGGIGAYKTFIALEIAHSVASGKPCFGTLKMLGEPAPVLAFLGEAAMTAVKQRWPALRRDRSGGLKHRTLPIHFILAVPTLGNNVDVTFCLDQARKIRKANGRLGLVIFDTLTRLTGALDSNATTTGNLVTELAEGIAREFDCPVWINSHHGKAGSDKGTAGSYAVEANSGNVWRVEADPLEKRPAAIRTGRQWAVLKPWRTKDAADWGNIYLAGRRLYPGDDTSSDGLALDGIGEEAFKLLKAAGAGGPEDGTPAAAYVRDVARTLKRLGAVDEEHAIGTTHLAKHLAYDAAAPGTKDTNYRLRTDEGTWYDRLKNSARADRPSPLKIFQRRIAPPDNPNAVRVELRWCLPAGYVVDDDEWELG